MDNAQKAIMIGVGLFITIIIISVVLLITNLGTGMVEDASDNVGNVSASLQNTLINSYDYKIVSGSDVQSLYTQYKDSDSVLLVVVDDVDDIDAANYKTNMANKLGIVTTAGARYAEYIGDGTYGTPQVFSEGDLYTIDATDSYRTYVIRRGETLVGILCAKQ